MNAVAFDTLKFARTLQAEGIFTAEQSSRLVEALGDVLFSDLATKTDLREAVRESELRLEARIAELKADTQVAIAELKADTKSAIADSKTDVIRWVAGMVGFQTLVILGALVTLSKALH
jgi:hypothetical protein